MSHPQGWAQVPAPHAIAEPPVGRPWPGATFRGSVRRFWQGYTVFSGRASRSEYWWWQLAAAIVGAVINVVYQPLAVQRMLVFEEQTLRSNSIPTNPFAISGTLFSSPAVVVVLVVSLVWGLVTIVPTLALTARRLHDVDLSGWWALLYLVPGGAIVLLVFAVLEPKASGARFDSR